MPFVPITWRADSAPILTGQLSPKGTLHFNSKCPVTDRNVQETLGSPTETVFNVPDEAGVLHKLAELSEFGGGVLTALGLFNPLGLLGVIGSMSMAPRKAHWSNPI